ncbi:putative beta-lysine N-acetyltransferase [Sphaerochaeta sp. S2]|uniref:putative beta-lysine N-acetyltransferase n=1 Tax=Sphaerochaeta sp. S2 TaxID=2798868 RepID=UPI0018E92135|nr:putative beta-lysine N-acetyltransferase [Sphaerochaeta sp. S2]MBJ2356696.1 putative beta-lysine N-acetyltransferase [Sphaerochaeta sp. S2]
MGDTNDTLLHLDGALVQHGKSNDRIYLMDPGTADASLLVPKLVKLAEENGYGKIFTKIPRSISAPFLEAGFLIEATAEKLFHGEEEGLFLGMFLDEKRHEEVLSSEYEKVRELAFSADRRKPSTKYSVRLCSKQDAESMATIYGKVFDSYPFAIDDPSFIMKTMDEGTVYAGIEEDGNLVALASGECSFKEDKRFSEMTDFATLPNKRGNGYALHLLAFLEDELRKRGILTAYTIARAISPGMNITFAKAGYTYGGRLHNNTNIAGNIESMNVWYKSLV